MKERLEIYENGEFNIRVVRNEQGEPLFCLKDVCEELGLQTKQVVRRLMDDVFSKHPIVDSLGRTQQATFVNEDGLYDTILESRKPEAKRFRKWVTSEVLPDIRRHGGYIVAMDDEPDEVIIARALQLTHNKLQKRGKRDCHPATQGRIRRRGAAERDLPDHQADCQGTGNDCTGAEPTA